jgi:hypothetical protein
MSYEKMVRPAVRREIVFDLQKVYDIGERGACKATGFHRCSQRYRLRRDPQTELHIRLKDLAASQVRYGRLHVLLLREGFAPLFAILAGLDAEANERLALAGIESYV